MRSTTVALTLLAAAACGGSEPTAAAGGSGGGGGSSGSGGDGGCFASGAPAGAICVEAVNGRLLDEQGAVLPEVTTTVCGAITCSPGMSDADGRFTVEVGSYLLAADYSTIAHARPIDKAGFYFQLPLDATGPQVDVGDLLLLDMPADGEPIIAKQDNMGAPAQTVTSSGVTLEVAEGVQIQLELDDIALGADGRMFRVRRVPDELQPLYVPDALGVVALWAFYPYEASFRPEGGDPLALASARVSFPNDAGLAADSAVELLALGSFIFPDWVTPATFEVVASGQVSADGQRIEMDPGEGVSYLTWIGIRPAS